MTKHEQQRLIRWRGQILQHSSETQNVARTCRHFGISRQAFYKWRARHAEFGEAGLADCSLRIVHGLRWGEAGGNGL
ncbi:MAG: hypothetical protein DRI90_08460, partial [Deltaproteobacteria bacterium]